MGTLLSLSLSWFLRVKFRSINSSALYPALNECIIRKNLTKGRVLHALVTEHGLETNTFWGSHLVRMYASCERLLEVDLVFERLPQKNVFTWGILILAHARVGEANKSIELYNLMQTSHIDPNQCVYVAVIKACAIARSLCDGMVIHSRIVEDGLVEDSHVASALIGMYSKCGKLCESENILALSPLKNVVMWNSMLAACAEHGNGNKAIQVFFRMIRDGTRADQVTYLNLLKACSASNTLLYVKREFHAEIVADGFDTDVFLGSTLIDMYCRSRNNIEDAWVVFYSLISRTVVTWNAMMRGLVQNGFSQEVFQLFQQLMHIGIQPDSDTYTSVIKACANNALSSDQGRFVHTVIDWTIWGLDPFIISALISMYVICGPIDLARRLFEEFSVRNIVMWNALMSAYIQHGDIGKVFDLFQQMLLEGVEPDRVTFLNVLKVCSIFGDLSIGHLLHSLILQYGMMKDIFIGSVLVEMYCSLGCPDYAYQVFKVLPTRNNVTWNTMISGYAEHGDFRMAFHVFQAMYGDGVQPDNITYSSILKACVGAIFLGQGRLIHFLAASSSGDQDWVVCHGLIHMYTQAGSFLDANKVFESLSEKNIVACNSMISGYARYGDYSMAAQFFLRMISEGIKPDDMTFFGLLSACSHAVRVQEACIHINSMVENHGIKPSCGHLYSVADLLARMGCLNEAEAIVRTIPIVEHLDVGCLSLIGHSGKYGHIDQARKFFNYVL